MIHPLADVHSSSIGPDTRIWQFSVVLAGAKIGNNCNICSHTYIENDVVIGNNVTIKAGVYLWDGVEVQDDAFIGPNVTFTNDKYPRSQQAFELQKTLIKQKASLGAAAVILGGITIGEFAMVAAGSVVSSDVPARALVKGSPARVTAWLNEDGTKMLSQDDFYVDNLGNNWRVQNNELLPS